jgi:CRP/FNR family cyclic AMP-dependent transcriptional regulator
MWRSDRLPPAMPDPAPMHAALHAPLQALASASSALRALAARGTIRHYGRDTVLIEEGDCGANDSCDALYIILSGRLRAYSDAGDGTQVTYGIYGAGEYLGEMSLDGGPRSASVMALEPSVCAVVTRQMLSRHLAEHPHFTFELLATVARRTAAADLSARQLRTGPGAGPLQQ